MKIHARGPLSQHLLDVTAGPPRPFEVPAVTGDALSGDDFHLALYLCYEMHYRGLPGSDDRWEWEPSLVGFRRALESSFEVALFKAVGRDGSGNGTVRLESRPVPEELRSLAGSDDGPSLADRIHTSATIEELKEFIVHRSAYHLKEADPHSWAIPRLSGRAKAALVEIQADEYGSGSAERSHAHLFAQTMVALGLDPTYGAYLNRIPGVTLATVNLMSMFGLNRRWRGAVVGHLALFEMTSSGPNRKYGNALRRLGVEDGTPFFDEHVEADAVHEMIAAHDMAGSLELDEPELADDIVFGARALVALDALFARHLLDAWGSGRSSLYDRQRTSPVTQPVP